MALKTSSSDELPSLNLTPMIDVVFLLIIFFMVGTQFTGKETHIDLTLPGAGQLKAMVAPPDRREVAITANGAVMLDGLAVDLDSLTSKLSSMIASYPDLGVVVRADGQVEHQHVASVFGAIQRAGVSDMSVAVRNQRPTLR